MIGIQSGPRDKGPHRPPDLLGGRVRDADCGDDSLAYFSRKMTIKAICRDLHVSRKVVRKVIRSQATEFHYERDVQPQPKIGPWRDRLDSLLLENDGKPARERLTLIRVFEELRGRPSESSGRGWRIRPGPTFLCAPKHAVATKSGALENFHLAREPATRPVFLRQIPKMTRSRAAP